MKNIKTYSAALLMAWAFASCSDFLDTVPDNRAEINTESQVASLLVSAYPQTYPLLIFEKASDNTTDNWFDVWFRISDGGRCLFVE